MRKMTLNAAKRKHYRNSVAKTVSYYGADIIDSSAFQRGESYLQHGDVSVYAHSLNVAYTCVSLAKRMRLGCNTSALVRGALLHDYFLYDWHHPNCPRLHGLKHASTALKNAAEDFSLSPREADMVKTHMFPLNIQPPRYRESFILCVADKICTVKEVFKEPDHSKLIIALSKDGEKSKA